MTIYIVLRQVCSMLYLFVISVELLVSYTSSGRKSVSSDECNAFSISFYSFLRLAN